MSSNLPTKPPDYLGEHPVWREFLSDIQRFSKSEFVPALIMAIGAFIIAWLTGQVTSSNALWVVIYSLLAGLAFYFIIAAIRAPIIVIGWHLRQISALSLKLAERLPEARVNSFSDFRVIREEPARLEFEFWYFYDGALGSEDIAIYASLENNGVAIATKGGGIVYEEVSVVSHKALAKMSLSRDPNAAINKSSHIVLSMVRETTDSVFYRQLIPYEKVWLDS
jgi:hypothetical protein